MSGLTHFDDGGAAHMVDISSKDATSRVAVARGSVVMEPETLAMIVEGRARKGDVLAVARLAGIMGAKRTPDLVPLCHPIALSAVSIDFDLDMAGSRVNIEAKVTTTGRTGVEMEALTAVSVTALTIYDMVKSVDRNMRISDTKLVFKDGGKSGRFEADR